MGLRSTHLAAPSQVSKQPRHCSQSPNMLQFITVERKRKVHHPHVGSPKQRSAAKGWISQFAGFGFQSRLPGTNAKAQISRGCPHARFFVLLPMYKGGGLAVEEAEEELPRWRSINTFDTTPSIHLKPPTFSGDGLRCMPKVGSEIVLCRT